MEMVGTAFIVATNLLPLAAIAYLFLKERVL